MSKENPKRFTDVIDLWPNRPALAADLNLSPGLVQKWAERDKIPASHWNRVVEAAKRRGYWQVTARRLALIAEGQ